jgi:hypothetical protein
MPLCHTTLELLHQLRLGMLSHRNTLERYHPAHRSPATLVLKLEAIERTLPLLRLPRLIAMSPGMSLLSFKTSKSLRTHHMIFAGTDRMVRLRPTTPMSCLATTRTHPVMTRMLYPDMAHKPHTISLKPPEPQLATKLPEHRHLALISRHPEEAT